MTVKIGLLGFGTVASGVPFLLTENAEKIKQAAQDEIEISKVLVKDDAEKERLLAAGHNYPFVTNVEDILYIQLFRCQAAQHIAHLTTTIVEFGHRYLIPQFQSREEQFGSRSFLDSPVREFGVEKDTCYLLIFQIIIIPKDCLVQ